MTARGAADEVPMKVARRAPDLHGIPDGMIRVGHQRASLGSQAGPPQAATTRLGTLLACIVAGAAD